MNTSDFGQHGLGRLVSRSGLAGDYLAYVPNPLPRSVPLGVGTINLLSRADLALGELKGIGQMLPNPNLLIGPFIRREAVSSSRIEGTETDFEQLVVFEADQAQGEDFADRQEVSNHVVATQYGLERLKTLPVCLRLIREVHQRLMQGVRGEDKTPGEFRKIQNMIGRKGQAPAEARFVPPPVPEMAQALDELERFIGHPAEIPVLIELAMIHYQFEVIRPFLDGNGRLGRLLISLLLAERGVTPQPLLYLSSYLERHRNLYVDCLLNVSRTGDWEPWFAFFLDGVAVQSRTAIDRSNELLSFRDRCRTRWMKPSNSSLILQLIDALFERPAVTITGVAQRFGVTFPAAQKNVAKLVADGILVEVTGKGRNRIYLAPEIVRIINKDDP